MLSKKQIENQVIAKAKKDLKKELKTQMKLPKIVGGLPSEFKLNPAMKQLAQLLAQDRNVTAPVSSQTVHKNGAPVITYGNNKGRMSCRIRHREFIQTISGVELGGYNVWFKPRVNPGSGSLFPWLADIADRFEKYKFHSMKLEYRTAVGTQTAGKVIISMDFDVLDRVPPTKIEQSMSRVLVEGPVWGNFDLNVDKGDLQNDPGERFIAASINNNFVSGAIIGDQKTYDIARLIVATSGVGTDHPFCGELWITYDVELITPTSPPESGNAVSGTCDDNEFLSRNVPSQNGNVYFLPVLNSVGTIIRCDVPGEYKLILVTSGTAMSTPARTLSINEAFSPDTVIQQDGNLSIVGSFTRNQTAYSVRAREGDSFTFSDLAGAANYVLYMFEFPYPE